MSGGNGQKQTDVKWTIFGVSFAGPIKLALSLLGVVLVVATLWFWQDIKCRLVGSPMPRSVALELTSSSYVEVGSEETCTDLGPWSRDCHNRKDGEYGCPDFQTFSLTARTESGALRDPRIVCEFGGGISCRWNFDSHFKRATWQWLDKPTSLEYSTPISSKTLRIKVCATEAIRELRNNEPEIVQEWEDLSVGSAIAARVPSGSAGFLVFDIGGGERRVPLGQSVGPLNLESKTEVGASQIEYGYTLTRSGCATAE